MKNNVYFLFLFIAEAMQSAIAQTSGSFFALTKAEKLFLKG
jgi:hypothetical protein